MARDFNGTTDRIDYTSIGAGLLAAAHSFFLRVYLDALAHNTWLLTCHTTGDAGFAWLFPILTTGAMQPQTGCNRLTSTTVGLAAWHHVGYTYDGSGLGTGIHVYLDGAECSYASSGNGTPGSAAGTWSLGGRKTDDGRNLDGRMEYPGFWNRVITAAEIAALQVPCEPGMIRSGLLFAPTLAGNTFNDRISAQTGTADGTTDYAGSIIRTAGAAAQYTRAA